MQASKQALLIEVFRVVVCLRWFSFNSLHMNTMPIKKKTNTRAVKGCRNGTVITLRYLVGWHSYFCSSRRRPAAVGSLLSNDVGKSLSSWNSPWKKWRYYAPCSWGLGHAGGGEKGVDRIGVLRGLWDGRSSLWFISHRIIVIRLNILCLPHYQRCPVLWCMFENVAFWNSNSC